MERRYYEKTFNGEDVEVVKQEIVALLGQEIGSVEELEGVIEKYSELSIILEEVMAWKYINMTRYADNEDYSKSFNEYYAGVISEFNKGSFEINKKIYEDRFFSSLDEERYANYKKLLSNDIEMYSEKNVELGVEESELANKYGELSSKITVDFKGEEYTLLGMKKFLLEGDRNLREEAWRARYTALKDVNKDKNDILDGLMKIRVEMGENKGFSNYRDYMHKLKARFSYTPEDLYEFHEAVERVVVPFLTKLNNIKAKKLGVEKLRPWDTSVDVDGVILKPFETIDEFIGRGIEALSVVKKEYGENLRYMNENGYLDLENRKGKAPGGYNYPLYESGVPFIFMNAVKVHSDVVTLMHEAGHAMHSFATKDERLVSYQESPSEVAELASMSMEFISMEGWNNYYKDEDLVKARREQIVGALETLPWVMIIDAYQHWLYLNPNNTMEEREQEFARLMDRFNPGVDWSGLEVEKRITWISQLHIFEVPFYYIEYAISQLGAIGMYRNYVESKEEALKGYESFIKLGYSKSIEDIYKAANLRFDFSEDYIKELVEFLEWELEKL